MSEIIIGVLTGVLSSLAASSIFLFFLFHFRPKLDISPYIAVREDEEGTAYILKVINRTPREVIDIRCELTLMTPTNVTHGVIISATHLNLRKSYSFHLEKYDKKDKDAKYAARYVTYENLESKWPDDKVSYLQLRILAKDSLSGFSKFFSQSFYTKESCLVKGSHKFGDSLDVL